MINRVVLVGRMTRDPELRRTSSGRAVTSFSLALDRGFTTQDGQDADFIPCVVWNKSAESTAQYCHKGSLVGVDGQLRSRTYTNNAGQRVFVVEVLCDRVRFLESRREAQARNQNNSYSQPSYNNNNNSYQSSNNGNQSRSNSTANNNQNNNLYDDHSVDLDNEFGDDANSFDIMEDDIQF